jgi:hypothetical protein
VSFGMNVPFSSSFCRERTSEKKKGKTKLPQKPQNILFMTCESQQGQNSKLPKYQKSQRTKKPPKKKKNLFNNRNGTKVISINKTKNPILFF